jgi:protein KRI1
VSRCGGSADPSYILNRGWIDKEKKAVPTYEDIVGRERGEDESDDEDSPWGKIDEEEDFDDKADEFETEYNFRFEEPGAATIVTHPRQIDSAVRRGDDTRKLKRQAREERKAAEKAAREEEVARKKDAKRREMEGQLNALRKELGDGIDLAGLEKVLEGDWDEAEWERVVGAMLAGDGGEDEDKPSWDDGLGDEYMDADNDDDEADPEDAAYANEGEWNGEEYEEDEDWEGPVNMDADFIAFDEPKKSKKDKKKKGKGAEPEAEEGLTLEQRAARMKAAADETNDLDHEDEVGGLRTKFKYTKTAPQTFGLTPTEILLATDAELNALVSIKHMQPYRRGGLGRAGVGLGRRVRELKAKLARRRWGEEGERGEPSQPRAFHIERQGPGGANAEPLGKREEGRPGKRLGKKERQKRKAAEAEAAQDGAVAPEPEEHGAKRQKVEPAPAPVVELAEGAGEGKKRRRKKKKAAE